MLYQTGSDSAARPSDVRGELPEQQGRNWIRWLTRPNGARQGVWNNRGRRETVESDHAAFLVNDHNGREAPLLVGKRPGLEPIIERGFSAGKGRDVMLLG